MNLNKPIWRECYFGGCFDPIHLGHITIALEAKEELQKDLVLLPAGNPPHKKYLSPFLHRLTMCQTIAEIYNFKVNPIEGTLTGLTPTVNILQMLVPDLRNWYVPFLAGTDSIRSLHTWEKDPTILVENVLWVVSQRGDDPIFNPYLPDLKILKLKKPPLDTSSTKIKKLIKSSDYHLEHLMRKEVIEYIINNRLYLPEDTQQ